MASLDPLPSSDMRPKLAGRRILVVDDNEAVRAGALLLLAGCGCIVESARDGREACFMIASQGRAYDVIIAAARLSDMTAADLFLTLKKLNYDVPMVTMSGFGYDGGEAIAEARSAGINAHLYLPFRRDQLLDTLENAVRAAATEVAAPGRNDAPTQSIEQGSHAPSQARAAPAALVDATHRSRDSDRDGFSNNDSGQRDVVDCTVYAPPEVRRSEPFLVQVFAHTPSEADAVARTAEEFDDEARRRGVTSLGTEIARGSTLTFELEMRDAEVDPPAAKLVWQGRLASAQFAVEIPSSVIRETILGKVAVSQDSVPIGEVRFKLRLASPGAHLAEKSEPAGEARRYTQAFISYASRDRSEVIRRVQMLKSVGISFFQDVLNLEPGERWAQRLYERIDHADVLFLFWSTAAKESEWVAKEWQYALQKKGEEFIRPVGIEGPPIPAPPEALRHLHFGDPLLYFIQPPSAT